MIGSYGVVLCGYYERFCFSLKVSFFFVLPRPRFLVLFISRLKRPKSGFSSHFSFLFIVILLAIVLSVSFLMAVISPSLCFSVLSLSRCIDASTLSSMLANPLPPSILDTYSLSTSSLWYNNLCMVISFLVLWSICLSSSFPHFKNGPEYLTRGTAQLFISLLRFLRASFVASSFQVHLRHSFLIFFRSSPLVCWCQPQRCPSICTFPFLRAF